MKSYPKIYNVGHPYAAGLFDDQVLVEEKVDGSQFSFSLQPSGLVMRSKSVEIPADNVPSLFKSAAAKVRGLAEKLIPGWVYRGEALHRPKHNVLCYDRTPVGGIVLFDISAYDDEYLSREAKEAEGKRLGLEVVPSFGVRQISSALCDVLDLLEQESFLGGPKIEGLVFKNYSKTPPMFGKFVSEQFRERHAEGAARKAPRDNVDIIDTLGAQYCTEARWVKAAQHLAEQGTLSNTPADIGPLLKELSRDFLTECEAEVKEILWHAAKKRLCKRLGQGFPEWYKSMLLASAFE